MPWKMKRLNGKGRRMTKLLMMVGLPGSGKSLAAKILEGEGWVRVSKDDIRTELEKSGWKWSRENEKDVLDLRDGMVRTSLSLGMNVVSDDTNFGRKHKITLSQIARECGAEFEIRYVDVPLETCLEQNAQREGKAKVPENVIRQMYNTFVVGDQGHFPLSAPKVEGYGEKVVSVKGLPDAIICDLDGTLSLFEGKRSPYDASKCDEDDINWPIYEILWKFANDDFDRYSIIYLSGREDKYRDATMRFFEKYDCPKGELFMRPSGDFRKDWIVKRELFDQNVRGKFNVDFVLDDRTQVVKMWRGIGLTCLQCADGNF